MSVLIDPIDQLEDNDTNLDKYKCAGQIATKIMNRLVKLAKPNKIIGDLINEGNKDAEIELNNVYQHLTNKGLSFPILISNNNIAGHHYNPSEKLKEGDLLKIELGIHIDGYPAQIAYTTLVTGNNFQKVNDKRSNVLKAAIKASREIAKIMKPGILNTEIVKIMEKCAQEYNCNLPTCADEGIVPGIISYQISQYMIDFNVNKDYELEYIHRFILPKVNPTYDFCLQELPLEENEVYAIDIVMCSGLGKLSKSHDTSVLKRNYDKHVELKLKASRTALNSFKSKYPSLINNTDPSIKLGLKECINKEVLQPYIVVSEKPEEFIARIKFTVIVKDKPVLICGKQADSELSKLE